MIIDVNKPCDYDMGDVVEEWLTGDFECEAYSQRFQCGGIYNNNYMDIVGNRDHDCFYDCSNCIYKKE